MNEDVHYCPKCQSPSYTIGTCDACIDQSISARSSLANAILFTVLIIIISIIPLFVVVW